MRRLRHALFSFLATTLLASCGSEIARPSPTVHVWLTTQDLVNALSRQADVTPVGGGRADVTFDDSVTLQSIDGFGAAFTDSSASLIWGALAEAERDDLMAQLFSRPSGIGLSLMRVPMASPTSPPAAAHTLTTTATPPATRTRRCPGSARRMMTPTSSR